MRKTLGILGGMGPLATANLFRKIIELTEASCDQEHLNILIYNNTSIPDRTEYLTGRGIDPTKGLIESAVKLEAMGSDYLIMPCNTAHYFYQTIIEHIDIPFINMIEETVKYIRQTFPYEDKIGLLATEGTCKTGVYDSLLSQYGIEGIKPSKEKQAFITELIYGIKEGRQSMNLENFNRAIDELKSKGAHVFILGCTELSIAYETYKLEDKYIDPIEILSKRAITFSGRGLKDKGGR